MKQNQDLETAKQKLQNANEQVQNANEKLQDENKKLQEEKEKLAQDNNKLQIDVGAGLNLPMYSLQTAADILLSHKELRIARSDSRKKTNGIVPRKVPG